MLWKNIINAKTWIISELIKVISTCQLSLYNHFEQAYARGANFKIASFLKKRHIYNKEKEIKTKCLTKCLKDSPAKKSNYIVSRWKSA